MTTLVWIAFLLMEIVGLFKVLGQSACGNITSTAVCRCLKNSDGTWKVNCSGLGLSVLPNDIPVNTTYLYAEHNNLTEISHDTLLRLQHLRYIVLDANKMTTLPKFPKEIINIYASYNNIQSIDGAFDGLTSLFQVEMNHARVKVIKNTTFKDNLNLYRM
ncbi:asporin-like [Anneissia japonica]|uniref:asporin-like n=1 Tax=Anneissia japonica TaxID=1529436 RepID=UPI0014255EDE|nr:asporin-like [Anneissia japonica]